jgi:hypothetical protein
LEAKDEQAVSAALSAAVAFCEEDLQPKIERLYTQIITQSGRAAAKDLVKQLRTAQHVGIKAAVYRRFLKPGSKGFTFDAANEDARAWAKEHAASLVTEVSETTRNEINGLIEDMFAGDLTPEELSDELLDAIGDAERAELIAETETMAASNGGVQEAWSQAVDEGLLTGREEQVWIVTPDEVLCPICEGLDGQTAPIDGQFESDGDTYDGPPAHPRCRCTVGLQVGNDS